MLIKIGLQNLVEHRRSIAWLLDFPGAFAYGEDGPEALLGAPHALLDYQIWLGKHTSHSWVAELGDFDVRLVESWDNYDINDNFERLPPGPENYEVDAWFLHDWQPLSGEDIRRALLILEWSRSELLAIAGGLDGVKLAQEYPGERWSIAGILSHIANAEWWYLSRLGLAPFGGSQLPDDPFERLQVTRARLVEVLPGLEGTAQVVGVDGEFWSPRKLVRRAAWHERDHTGHIIKLL